MSGIVSLLTFVAMVLIGIWLSRTGLFPGFGTYSFLTIGVAILSAGIFMASFGSPIMGLAERITILVAFQWTFTLARWMFLKSREVVL